MVAPSSIAKSIGIEAASPSDVSLPTVLYLDHVGYLGGAELSLLAMVRHGPVDDHVVLMSDGPLRAEIEAAGIGVTTFRASRQLAKFRRESGLFSALLALPYVIVLARKVAKKSKTFDIVWANSQKAFIIGCFAKLMSHRPLIWHMRDILSAEHFSFINRKMATVMANLFANKVIVVSNAGLQSFLDSGGRPGLATVIYNGIDSNQFDAIDAAAARKAVLTQFPVGNVPLIGSFGRLTPWKGQHILIKALQLLPRVHAIIVGDASGEESDYAITLQTLAKDLGVSDRTHFIGFRHEVPQLMSAVDLVVHTSTAPEPFGRVIVEAMLARKPVIATDAGGAKEIITHDHDGILVPQSQADLLAVAIRDLLGNPDRAHLIADRAYRTATTRFSLATFLSEIERIKRDVYSSVPVGQPKKSLNSIASLAF